MWYGKIELPKMWTLLVAAIRAAASSLPQV